ncbi:FAD binding domain-containing protein [Xylariomycetidae sp. FL0641]|nr:FAD binding domain-containing protein [Xylariomycetidae sp. FL0641]
MEQPRGPRGLWPSDAVQCDALEAAGLGSRLLTPADAMYEEQINTWWATNTRRHPYCIVLPESSQEVSLALTTLLGVNDGAGDWHIAVRSGGHMPFFDANNIDQGVTIDLTHLNATSYDRATNTASLRPGGRWKDVYAALQADNVTVPGGRDGGVGVGGFLLGGGESFFAGRVGWGCDSVAGFEVVLANGSIVEASRARPRHADLWRALRGGGGNFGIVTRFDVAALPSREPFLFYDLRFFVAGRHADAVLDAVTAFTAQGPAFADHALVAWFTHNATLALSPLIGSIYVNTRGDARAASAYDAIRALPAVLNQTVHTTMADAAAGSQLPGGYFTVTSTLTLLNDAATLRRAAAALHAELVAALGGFLAPADFVTTLFLQPQPGWGNGVGGGGNVLGRETDARDAVLWTLGVSVDPRVGAGRCARARAEVLKATARAEAEARQAGTLVDFLYMNYAAPTQDALGSYGADNVRFLREVAARYDPAAAFQTRIPGGFKISRVGLKERV